MVIDGAGLSNGGGGDFGYEGQIELSEGARGTIAMVIGLGFLSLMADAMSLGDEDRVRALGAELKRMGWEFDNWKLVYDGAMDISVWAMIWASVAAEKLGNGVDIKSTIIERAERRMAEGGGI